MIQRTKDEDLFPFVIPITPQSPKYSRTVIQAVGRHTNFGFRIRYDLSMEKSIPWQICGHFYLQAELNVQLPLPDYYTSFNCDKKWWSALIPQSVKFLIHGFCKVNLILQ